MTDKIQKKTTDRSKTEKANTNLEIKGWPDLMSAQVATYIWLQTEILINFPATALA